ncbi:MAG: hypothetical protein EHM45_19760 [Desulfobacteraceae bacterium]|nr:MAG: hypothetical protein EHM45_19760 [Desulfobacteraceae bacterium]
MKKNIGWVVLLLFIGAVFSLSACRTDQTAVSTPIAPPPPQAITPGKALIYFMRPSGVGFAVNFQIWDGDHFVGLSRARCYMAYECDPGKHLFIGVAENKLALDADLEAGKTYYAGTNVRMGAFKARMDFTPVTRGSELWDKVDAYRASLNFTVLNEVERVRWETAKKAEAQKLIAFFNSEEGKPYIRKLNKEDGR